MGILVTGGCGYIGSHTAVELIQAGFEIIVLDNLSNASIESLKRVEAITGKAITFIEGDCRDKSLLDNLFKTYPISAVIHFAGLKAVGESVSTPLKYYDNNVYGSTVLLQAMQDAGVFNFVFSSSATVYGSKAPIPYFESTGLTPQSNPYGRSKFFIEEILRDLAASDPRWNIAILRYFNPVGAHESGLIGEDPNGIPNNLLPFISQVAAGKLEKLSIFGGDYPTPDGTGIRDYIHVVDLALGHVAALNYLAQHAPKVNIWNLGSGKGYSVLEMVKAFEEVSGVKIPYTITERRAGDLAEFFANADKAKRELNWVATRGLKEIMADTWLWQQKNPNGYAK